MGDPWMFPINKDDKSMTIATKNGFVYPSPEIIKFQKGEIDKYDKHSSDLFTFGMVLL